MEQKVRVLLKAYIDQHGLVRHHLDSFDHFIEDTVPNIVRENSHIVVQSRKRGFTHVIQFSNMKIPKPLYKDSQGRICRLTPSEARNASLTYASPILVDVKHEIYTKDKDVIEANEAMDNAEDNEEAIEEDEDDEGRRLALSDAKKREEVYGKLLSTNDFPETTLCEIPIMVRSGLCYTREEPDPSLNHECIDDPGGYFLVNGNEKIILCQEGLRHNFPFVTRVKKTGPQELKCEVRSLHESKMRSTSTLYLYLVRSTGSSMPEIVLELPFIKNYNIPLACVFRLLGVETFSEMRSLIVGHVTETSDSHMEHVVRSVLRDPFADLSIDALCDHIGQQGTKQKLPHRRIQSVWNVIRNEVLPHMGLRRDDPTTMPKRARYLGFIVRRLLNVHLGRLPDDDRDHYANKRLSTPGMLLGILFRQALRNYFRQVEVTLRKACDSGKYVNVTDILSSKPVTSALKYALSTGNWGMQKGGSSQTGIAQVCQRTGLLSQLSHSRRINTPVNKNGKAPEPRQLHLTHKYVLCPCETPEGAGCGLLKNFALMTHTRIGYPSGPLIKLVENIRSSVQPQKGLLVMPLLKAPIEAIDESTAVFVNGQLVGFTDFPDELHNKLRLFRRAQDIPFDVTIAYKRTTNEILVTSDEGCCLTPLFVVERLPDFDRVFEESKANPFILWNMMIQQGIIEYADQEEGPTLRIAERLSDVPRGNYTHAVIDPVMLLGVCANLIPFPEHNQAPRNMYQVGMGKQASGIPSSNYTTRFEKTHVLCYPQKPLVTTAMGRIIDYDERPAGMNVLVAIASFGENQEDSLIMDKSFVDVGGFHTTYYQTFRETERTKGADKEIIQKPDPEEVSGMQNVNFHTIGENGLCAPGTVINQDDVLIGKVMVTSALKKRTRNDVIKRDRSVALRTSEQAVVDRVVVSESVIKEGATCVRVRLRSLRQPEIGDKFSSRHGQKGVVGLVVPHEDMPFDARTGLTPNIIINPHCMPSRMTIGHLMEMYGGVAGSMAGRFVDGTAFRYTSVEQIKADLKELGVQEYSEFNLTDGRTGLPIENSIFMGIAFYQRLKHMPIDKVHARARGPVVFLTRQPNEGRSREGGLRCGEMERDGMVAHGVAAVTADRLHEQSDDFETPVCRECGFFAEWKDPNDRERYYGHVVNPTDTFYCRYCDRTDSVVTVHVPYAFCLLIREMEACHVAVRMKINEETGHCELQPVCSEK